MKSYLVEVENRKEKEPGVWLIRCAGRERAIGYQIFSLDECREGGASHTHTHTHTPKTR